MPPIQTVGDQPVLVATSEYPFAEWKFEKFNPVQSRVFEYYDKENNGLVAAQTSAGKTVVAEMFISHEIRKRGGKGMFLAPLRALAQEKIDDWTDSEYHFKDKKIGICTGDYRMSSDRQKELTEADVIIMTSEMLNHRSRNYKSEKNSWLMDVGTLVIDESHLLTVPSRGADLEVGLMKFTEINPNCRLVLLSATMPNVEEIAEWVSYSLTKRETVVLRSKYRPCPLTVHYERYDDSMSKYDQIEDEKVYKALDIIEYYPDDKFLVFAHTKRTGEKMKKELRAAGIAAEFHNANLDKKERVDVERRFREDPKLRVIVATPTLAWGLNMPARRVIILGVHRGIEEVESYNIRQEIGRSGRVGLDPAGDAYILVPDSKADEHKDRLNKPEPIQSQLLQTVGGKFKVLAFHLVSEIVQETVSSNEDVHHWYRRSLAYWQSKGELDESIVDSTLLLLKKCGAIYWNEEEEGWRATSVGKISSMFYMSPFDVSDWKRNFNDLFADHKENDDFFVSMALGNVDTQRMGITSKAEKDEISVFMTKIRTIYGHGFYNEASVKAGYCYFTLLNGNNVQSLAGFRRNLQFDAPRICQVLRTLDSMSGKWNRERWFHDLERRIQSGVPVHLLDLCQIKGIGKIYAKRLYDAGISTPRDLADFDDEGRLKRILNLKSTKFNTIMDEARRLAASG